MNDVINRAAAYVNLNNINENYQQLRKLITPTCNIMAVVKADAYGHGAIQVASRLESLGVKYFAVASINEGIELRENGIKAEILILGHTPIEQAYLLFNYNFTQTVASYDYSAKLNEFGILLNIHIKIDSGMSRIGFYAHDEESIKNATNEIKKVSTLDNLKITGIFTHFAEADNIDDSSFTELQFSNFIKTTDSLIRKGINIGLRHCCNSAAIIRFPHMHLDMVRPGIFLYGLSPVKTSINLKPAMQLKALITHIKEIQTGDTVSYGRTYKADKKMKIATVAIGYADGYIRRLSNKDSVVINGYRAPILGRICMDVSMIDITGINAQEGDLVTIFGEDKNVKEISDILDTIIYEVLCLVSKRVPRFYFE